MRECARAEAHRLKGGRFTLDRSLTLALLRSAKGGLESRTIAKAMLDAQERAAVERDRQAALARIADCARRYWPALRRRCVDQQTRGLFVDSLLEVTSHNQTPPQHSTRTLSFLYRLQ